MLSSRLLVHVSRLNKKACVGIFRLVPEIRVTATPAICTSPWNSATLILDRENRFAHDILKTSTKPYQVFRTELDDSDVYPAELPAIVLNPPPLDTATIDDVFTGLCAALRYCVQPESKIAFSDMVFKPLTELFCRQAEKLSDDQILQLLRLLANKSPSNWVNSPNYVELWNTLDIVCTRRAEQWSVDELLMFCDAWYSLGMGKICEFFWGALYRLSRKIKRMKVEHLVHTMFFCNIVRKPLLDMFDFQINMERSIDKMSLAEIGVMSMGFFKTKTKIRSKVLIDKIYERLISEVDTVEDITLVSMLKILRYSSIPQTDSMVRLLEALCPQIERLSLLSCLHISLLGSDIHCCHEPSFELILQRFVRGLDQARLKDMERLCLVMNIYNYKSPNDTERILSTKILEALKHKVDEIMIHPRCFPTCVHYLSVKGFYDAEMISSVLEKRFLEHTYAKSRLMGREVFYLDAFTRINLKNENYNGNQLSDNTRRTMGKLLTHYMPERNQKFKLSFTDRLLLEIKEATEGIIKTVKFKHILPHFERPDIVLCYDREKREPIEISPKCAEDYIGTILTREELLGDNLSDNIDTIAIIIVGRNNVVREFNRHTGLMDLKLEQLKLLGHKYILIYWHEWRELTTAEERESLIKRRLATVTNI